MTARKPPEAKLPPAGNPDPSPSTRFGQPNGNIPGQTSESRRLAIQAAERSLRVQDRLLQVMEEQLSALTASPMTAEQLGGVLKEFAKTGNIALMKMAQDRGLGTPKQTVDVNNPDGALMPMIHVAFATPEAVALEQQNDHDDEPENK